MALLVALQSVLFQDSYLSLDGRCVTQHIDGGGGAAKIQTYVSSYETFALVVNGDGTVSFKSTAFNDVYLRLDGAHVSPNEIVPSGGGVVNAQFGAGPAEKFRIHKKADVAGTYHGVVGIESFGFPGRYLRLDGATQTVNVQGTFLNDEEFRILVVGYTN